MFCCYCGKNLPDEAAFCCHCGKALPNFSQSANAKTVPEAPVSNPTPPADPAIQYIPAYKLTQYGVTTPANSSSQSFGAQNKSRDALCDYRSGWYAFIRSPLMLLAIIAYGLTTILNIITLQDSLDMFYEIFSLLDMDAESILLTVLQILIILPGVITSICMLILFSEGSNDSHTPINTGAINTIRITIMVVMIVSLVMIGLGVIMVFFAAGSIPDGDQYDELRKMCSIIIFGGIFAFGLVMWYGKAIDCVLSNAIYSANFGGVSTYGVLPLAVVQFIIAALNILTLYTDFFTFQGVLSALSPLLFGAVLLQYRGLLNQHRF